MKVNTKSIAFKMVFGGVLVVLLPLVVVGVISFKQSKNSLVDISNERARTVAAELASFTRNLLDLEIHQARTLAAQKKIVELAKRVKQEGIDASRGLTAEVFEDLKGQYANLHPHYQGLFLTDTEGWIYTGVLDGGQEYKDIDLGSHPGFKKVKDNVEPCIDEIIISKATGKPVSGALVPIKSESGDFLGMFGAVIKAEFFIDVISGRKIGKTGYGFMLNKEGVVLSHPVADNILKLDAAKIPEMKAIVAAMLEGKAGVVPYQFQGDHKIAGFAPVGINGWSVAMTQNSDEFLSTSTFIRNTILVVTLVAAFLAVCIVTIQRLF